MIAFIDDHRGAYGVEPICRVLPIAPATYRTHAARRADPAKLPARSRRDLVLAAEIRRVFEANFRVYGVRKVWRRDGAATPPLWHRLSIWLTSWRLTDHPAKQRRKAPLVALGSGRLDFAGAVPWLVSTAAARVDRSLAVL